MDIVTHEAVHESDSDDDIGHGSGDKPNYPRKIKLDRVLSREKFENDDLNANPDSTSYEDEGEL